MSKVSGVVLCIRHALVLVSLHKLVADSTGSGARHSHSKVAPRPHGQALAWPPRMVFFRGDCNHGIIRILFGSFNAALGPYFCVGKREMVMRIHTY